MRGSGGEPDNSSGHLEFVVLVLPFLRELMIGQIRHAPPSTKIVRSSAGLAIPLALNAASASARRSASQLGQQLECNQV
jgi:hypothetical protein